MPLIDALVTFFLCLRFICEIPCDRMHSHIDRWILFHGIDSWLPLSILPEMFQCPDHKVYILKESVRRQPRQSDCCCLKSPSKRHCKGELLWRPGQEKRGGKWERKTYATSSSPLTLNVRLTAWGWSSASTSMTCFANRACFGDAKGILIVLCNWTFPSTSPNRYVQSTQQEHS